jgi:predicted SprT family Zn-dependent metalloprotease
MTAQDFRQIVLAEHAALFSKAQAQLEELLRQCGPGKPQPTCQLPHAIEIRDLGRAAGRCTPGGTIVVNSQLIDHPEEIRATVAHELAHAVVETARRELLARHGLRRRRGAFADVARRRGAWSAHGAIWQAIARQLGDGGERCHRLPLEPKRRLRRFLYRADCGAEVVLSSVRHNRLQRNRGMEYRLAGRGARVGWRHFVEEVEN